MSDDLQADRGWRARLHDPSLTALLVVQMLIVMVIIPASAAGVRIPAAVPAAVLVTVMSSVIFLGRGRWAVSAGLTLLGLSALSALARAAIPGREADLANALMILTTYLTLSAIVLQAVFGPGKVNAHRIRGAIVFYINLGLMFALAHRAILDWWPDAYSNMPSPDDRPRMVGATTYFSFMTLTSVGYGDIVPVHPVARAAATLEAILGQLFPTTLLARIVMLEMESRRR